MLQFLESKFYADFEGTCSGQFGYIVAVYSILDIEKGMVTEGTGQAEFITWYKAIVFKTFKGEVVGGLVNNVDKVRSPSGLFHAIYDMSLWKLRRDGFLCGRWTVVGFCIPSSTRLPLTNFLSLSSRDLHPDMKHDPNSNPPSFASDEVSVILTRCLVCMLS
jgi:DNA-directed RNA polymerase II subunit RPB7